MRFPRVALIVCLSAASAFAQTTDVWRQRLLAYKPYDGAGRYTISADDGVRGIQGLKELASRWGQKPYEQLQVGEGEPARRSLGEGGWASERVIFRDVDTGAWMARLTNDPWTDYISYFHNNWSADGKYIVWRRRPAMWEPSTATHGPMAMRADGTELRNVFRDYPMVRNEVCSPTDPNVCFATPSDKKVVAFDIATGKKIRELHDISGCWHVKISIDGKYLMGRSDVARGGKGFWILSTDGAEYHEVQTDGGVHDSYQFHPSLPNRIMFWYDGRYRTEGFVQCDFEGGNLSNVKVLFDWNHGDVGPDRGAHTDGTITRIRGETWLEREPLFAKPGVEYYDDPHDTNGYLAWRPKDRLWVYSTRIIRPPHISEIHSFYAECAADFVANRFRICYTALHRGGALDNPNASPDGTKVLFNSDMLDRVDVYSVVARLPETPVDLKALRVAEGVKLSWKPPKHHAEVAGYHVYRSAESGRGFEPVTAVPVAGTEFVDAGADGKAVYAVAAVEHSGLESPLNDEVAVNPLAKHCVTIEAEDGARSVEMWQAFHGTASSLHYVWMRRKDARGKTTLNATLPVSGLPWTLWGRVKGEKAVQFTATVGGLPARLDWGPSADWTWVRFAGYLPLKAGANEITLTSDFYGSAIDCLVATDDPAYQPAAWCKVKWPALAAPAGLTARATSCYSVKLAWKPVAGTTVHHYNVYASADANVAPRQENLIASPDTAAVVDWGLAPGRTLYYVVTAVDRAMNESAPSQPVKVALGPVERVNVAKDGTDTVAFDVPAKGDYVVWLLLKKADGGGNYVDVGVDGQKRTWTCGFDGLSSESWFSYGPWGVWTLDAGQHTLTIANKTKHAAAKVFITNDLSQRPEGHVNILGGW